MPSGRPPEGPQEEISFEEFEQQLATLSGALEGHEFVLVPVDETEHEIFLCATDGTSSKRWVADVHSDRPVTVDILGKVQEVIRGVHDGTIKLSKPSSQPVSSADHRTLDEILGGSSSGDSDQPGGGIRENMPGIIPLDELGKGDEDDDSGPPSAA